jgi:rhodanese-related sulfurtransferase
MKRAMRWIGVMGVIAVVLLLVGRGQVEISPEEAREQIRQGKYDVIVDVRTPEEWARGHRSDAVNIPIGEFVSEFPKKVPRKEDRILFVCRKGIRAPAAALMAQKKGYRHVQAVVGEHDGLV